jgi:hypothetical protein
MRTSVVVLAAVAALGACGRKDGSRGDRPVAQQDLVSVTGVVADVKEKALQVRTDDGRMLNFAMNDGVAVTLGGGESQPAVLTEGAPVRVSYKPKGGGADLVSIDVEPQAPESKGQAPVRSADPPAHPSRAAGASGAGSGGAHGAGEAPRR